MSLNSLLLTYLLMHLTVTWGRIGIILICSTELYCEESFIIMRPVGGTDDVSVLHILELELSLTLSSFVRLHF